MITDDVYNNTLLLCCKGSDVHTGRSISVEFLQFDSDIERRPIARTCACILQLASNYDTFVDFRKEFNNVLNSGIWIMDII